jgi:hypothetical protein
MCMSKSIRLKLKYTFIKNKDIYVIIIGSSFSLLPIFFAVYRLYITHSYLFTITSLFRRCKKKEEREYRQRRNEHIYMRISWFDDAWRSKTEQTAERLLLDTLHAQRSREI